MNELPIWLTHAQILAIGKLTAEAAGQAPIALSRTTWQTETGHIPAIRVECADEHWTLGGDGVEL